MYTVMPSGDAEASRQSIHEQTVAEKVPNVLLNEDFAFLVIYGI